MEKSFKEQLSDHVEGIFKTYSKPGLHICDIATGGGKSYTIGKLTCEYYLEHFDRIIILCVQKKLVEGMNREIDRFINLPSTKIKAEDKLVLENNVDVIRKAINNDKFLKLIENIEYKVGEMSAKCKTDELKKSCNTIKKDYEGIKNLISTFGDSNNPLIQKQIITAESKLRNDVREFFQQYRKVYSSQKKGTRLTISKVIRDFPSLKEVYPQVDYSSKKVFLMTVHKAMYGIDPILSEKITLHDMVEKNTLILFDESDQAAIAMRNAIIEQATDSLRGDKRFSKGYKGYLQYKGLVENKDYVSDDTLSKSLKEVSIVIGKNWEEKFGKTGHYRNIFLGEDEDFEDYRRGVFFSGPTFKFNISRKNDKSCSFICYKKGDTYFRLHHEEDNSQLKQIFDFVVPMEEFLTLVMRNKTSIKSSLSKIVKKAYKESDEEFKRDIEDVSANKFRKNNYLGYPTLEREIHTLFSRFEEGAEFQLKQELLEFITNRKNLIVQNEDNILKIPDNTVYSQGIKLYQEEIDEIDNRHRIQLSCREINTTPEKILLDLLRTEGVSIVLCSATASSMSVINNFDIKYLRDRVGEGFSVLSENTKRRFDELVLQTYPSEHKVEIVPLEHYNFNDNRDEKLYLPEKYRQMFSKEAREDGLDKLWFTCTKRELMRNKKSNEGISYHFYRLFQFIEAYYWFINHNDVRSMIFFQNRNGDPIQANVLSCLIDGSYKNQNSSFIDELPRDWSNEYIRISKDWEEVEDKILSELSKSKDAKIMLLSAYASFKAGANMQYEVPDGLDFIQGDNWETERLKKDWDAMYLQCPTAYLMMNEDGNESTFEKSLYNIMLSLMMLYERGCLSENEVASWLCKAISNCFYFTDKNNDGILNDKAAWAQTIVEQAVGRLCRTRNKPQSTYILFDMDMARFFDNVNLQKSLTKEFRALSDYILNLPKLQNVANLEDIVRENNANYAKRQLDRMRRIALRYTPSPYREDEEEKIDIVPRNVKVHQEMNQIYKQAIIKKPVINNEDDLQEENKYLTFIGKCYGDWTSRPVLPSDVRLDVLMKNSVIKKHFEENGFATDWKPDGLILHPDILRSDYAGEIGEEAFKAIVLQYTNCTENDFVHLEGIDYELADFVIYNPDRKTYKIAFDVKNMNPLVEHLDKQGDMITKDKRTGKIKRLGCQLITVNMLQLPTESMDGVTEIHGIIDGDGNVIPSAIETLKKLIE